MSKVVTYDLRAPGRDYDSLIEAIKTYKSYAQVAESSWVISTSQSAVEVRDHLRRFMDSNDRIFVGALTGEAAWIGAISSNDAVKTALNS